MKPTTLLAALALSFTSIHAADDEGFVPMFNPDTEVKKSIVWR